MKIGVISDTHITRKGKMLPNNVYKAFEGVDFIIHAGDISIEETIIELQAIAPVYAVAGNNDGYEMFEKYGIKKLLDVNGRKIGITHGNSKARTYLTALREFKDNQVDCVVYGHSHIPHNEIINGILFFNPGSPTNKRSQPRYSVGLLYIDDTIHGEIIFFD